MNYNPVAGGVPSLLNADEVQCIITLQPVRRLTADNTYLLDRDHSVANGAFVYENQVFRTKINYQFTRSISARVIAEYDSTLANPAETSLLRTKQIGTQALFTWLPHPGTVVYVGYNNDLQNLDRSLCNRGLTGACDPDNPVPPARQQLPQRRQADLREVLVSLPLLGCCSRKELSFRPTGRGVEEPAVAHLAERRRLPRTINMAPPATAPPPAP